MNFFYIYLIWPIYYYLLNTKKLHKIILFYSFIRVYLYKCATPNQYGHYNILFLANLSDHANAEGQKIAMNLLLSKKIEKRFRKR